VPGYANPQSLNRYSYTLNNPIRFIDPSGHKACDNTDSHGNCVTDKFGKLLDFVYDKVTNKDSKVKGKFTALDAMNTIVKKAAYLYGSDWDGFLKATNYVFLGTDTHSPYTMSIAHSIPGFHGITFDSNNGDTGFHSDFQQGGENQVHHFWAAFGTAANNGHRGEVNATYGNFYHDVIEDWIGHKDTTYSDFTLSVAGINIGHDVNTGAIKSPSELPGIFDTTIGTNSTGYTGPSLLWLFTTPNE
jgi:hypothetical protein